MHLHICLRHCYIYVHVCVWTCCVCIYIYTYTCTHTIYIHIYLYIYIYISHMSTCHKFIYIYIYIHIIECWVFCGCEYGYILDTHTQARRALSFLWVRVFMRSWFIRIHRDMNAYRCICVHFFACDPWRFQCTYMYVCFFGS